MLEHGISFDFFLEGRQVALVVLTEEIVEKTNWYNWFNDEVNMRNMQKHYFPNTRANQLEFFRKEIAGSKSKFQLGIFNKQDRALIGMISLNHIDYLNQKCELSVLIGEKKYQNLTNFIEACRLIVVHAFDHLNMNRIYGGCIAKELAEMYVRILGFQHEGTSVQDIFKNGMHLDCYRFALLKSDYLRQIDRFKKSDTQS